MPWLQHQRQSGPASGCLSMNKRSKARGAHAPGEYYRMPWRGTISPGATSGFIQPPPSFLLGCCFVRAAPLKPPPRITRLMALLREHHVAAFPSSESPSARGQVGACSRRSRRRHAGTVQMPVRAAIIMSRASAPYISTLRRTSSRRRAGRCRIRRGCRRRMRRAPRSSKPGPRWLLALVSAVMAYFYLLSIYSPISSRIAQFLPPLPIRFFDVKSIASRSRLDTLFTWQPPHAVAATTARRLDIIALPVRLSSDGLARADTETSIDGDRRCASQLYRTTRPAGAARVAILL